MDTPPVRITKAPQLQTIAIASAVSFKPILCAAPHVCHPATTRMVLYGGLHIESSCLMPTPRLCRIKEFGIDRSLFFSRTCAANNLYTCGIIFACSDTSRAVASREQEECSAYLCRPLHIVTLSAGLRASRESLELCRVQASVRPVVAGVVLSMRHNPSVGIMNHCVAQGFLVCWRAAQGKTDNTILTHHHW